MFGYGYGVLEVPSSRVPGFAVFLFLGTVVHSVVLQWLWSLGSVARSSHYASSFFLAFSRIKSVSPVFQESSHVHLSLASSLWKFGGSQRWRKDAASR